ncbi:MAG TPA: hypothetical protein VFH47_03990, partial [Candidatus Thermoplasmatota archaeon]|nr:hypothetical protein [Candidatus Thermoplasmatota archaeon]
MARVLLSLLLLLSLLAPHVAVQAQLDGVEYELFIACPGADGFTFSLNTGGGCPVRAVDGQDVMGAPSLAVDPHEPNNLIIASLHGGVYKRGSGGPSFFAVGAQSCPEPGPTPKSRCGQAFTTFTSTDSGAYWVDNPFVPPQKLGFRAFGEHPQVTIDPYGRAYVGSLYAVPEGGSFRYVIAAQKFSSLETINEEQDGEYALKYIEPLFNRSSISQMWYIYNPATDNMTVVWHEAPQGPASRGGASFTPSAARLTGAVWAESGPAGEGEAPATAARSAIGLVWTTPRPNATYHRTPASESIGPCLRSTNPVLEDGYIYIGCQVDASAGPFPWNPKAADGQVELFRMHPDGGKPQYMGSSPVVGGSPKLGVRSDGRLALLSTAPGEDGMLQLYGAFGSYDARSGRIEWGRLSHYAPEFRVPNPAERVVRSNIQDLVYREYSG